MGPTTQAAWPRTSWAFRMSAALLVATTVGLLVATQSPVAALAPTLLVALAFAVWHLPFGVTCAGALFVLLLADNVKENPGMGLYKSFLYAPGELLYRSLEESVGIPGAKFFGIELLLIALAGVATLRFILQKDPQGEGQGEPARPFILALWVAMGAIVFMEVWGILRGGQIRFSMLQFRPMLATSLMGLLFATSFKTRRELYLVLGAFVLVALIRNSVGIYYWATILRLKFFGGEGGGDGTYVTTHSDSAMSGIAVVVLILAVMLRPSFKTWTLAGLFLPILAFGIHVNNRRLAIVAIVLSLALVYFVSDRRFRAIVNKALVVLIPAVVLYIAVGWGSSAGWARPVQTLKSVAQSTDDSAKTRDIENYNLVQTIKKDMLLGSGFGHEYDEIIVAYDISHVFEAYRYVPHNSLLGLFMAGGILGFAAFWTFTVVGVFLAVRAFPRTRSGVEQVVCMAAVAAVVQYGVLAWGDMGLQSWMCALVLSSLLGCVAQIATRTGAWTNAPARA